MTIEICDICGERMATYTDLNGKTWDAVSFQEKKYRRKICCFGNTWTEYISICGNCRAEIAKRRKKEQDYETD